MLVRLFDRLAAARRYRRWRVGRVVPFVPLLAALLGGCENVSLGDITPPLADQSPLADSVRAAFDANPELAGLFIRVKSLDGDTVRLSGTVQRASQRHVAERTAAAVPGVRSVVNSLFLRE